MKSVVVSVRKHHCLHCTGMIGRILLHSTNKVMHYCNANTSLSISVQVVSTGASLLLLPLCLLTGTLILPFRVGTCILWFGLLFAPVCWWCLTRVAILSALGLFCCCWGRVCLACFGWIDISVHWCYTRGILCLYRPRAINYDE